MPWAPDRPYDDLPLLPPREELETRAVLKSTVGARTALAQLDQAARLLPDPDVLINAIPILEAQASSEIENIVTTSDALFRYADRATGNIDEATKEALRYRQALITGVLAIKERPLTSQTAARVCSVLQSRPMDVRRLPGTRIADPSTGQILYAPPEGAPVIVEKLTNWERFIHAEDDLDPLVRMAVAHYQFEAIHPFADGNGRTGRIVNILMLIEAGLINDPILSLSRRIIATKSDYYRLLLEVTREGAWEGWILYILDVVRRTASSTVSKISSIRTLQAIIHDEARAATPGGRNADLLNVLFEQPYCRISNVVDRCHVSRPTATTWLNDLVNHGVLHDRRVGRERLFVNTRFLEVLIGDDNT